MTDAKVSATECQSCSPPKPTFFARYRDFLLSRDSILTFINALLLLVGIFLAVGGLSQLSQLAFLLSALIGGTPLFIFAAKGLFINRDITAGVMASVADCRHHSGRI
jgi:hypothetical protein